jgi:hypothetical protein
MLYATWALAVMAFATLLGGAIKLGMDLRSIRLQVTPKDNGADPLAERVRRIETIVDERASMIEGLNDMVNDHIKPALTEQADTAHNLMDGQTRIHRRLDVMDSRLGRVEDKMNEAF